MCGIFVSVTRNDDGQNKKIFEEIKSAVIKRGDVDNTSSLTIKVCSLVINFYASVLNLRSD